MKCTPSIRQAFDAQSLRPLNERDLSAIQSECRDFKSQFNKGLQEDYRVDFTGAPLDFDKLDYDFYEFGGGNWYRDNGFGFTCVWGTILVDNFGFRWESMNDATTLRDCVLRHEEASFIFFPWQHVWSFVESIGYAHHKAQGAWIQIVKSIDSVYVVPDGWHPAIDAIEGATSFIPPDVVGELRMFRDESEKFLELLGLHPYEWTEVTDWDAVKNWIHYLRLHDTR